MTSDGSSTPTSRIIVKNLPQWITEDRLSKHFAAKGQVTDVKLMYTRSGMFRRFAYVGFTSVNEAACSVKYFDRTFLDTARIEVQFAQRIGSDELSRPWSKYSLGSSAHTSYLKTRAVSDASTEKKSNTLPAKDSLYEEMEKKKKLLASIYGEGEEGTQLRSFVNAMKPASKTKLWENDTEQKVEESFTKRNRKIDIVAIPDKRNSNRGSLVTRVHVKFDENEDISDDDIGVYNSKNEDDQTQNLQDLDSNTSDDEEYQDFGIAPPPLPITPLITPSPSSPPSKSTDYLQQEVQNVEETYVKPAESRKDSPTLADSIIETGRLFVRNLSYSSTEEEVRRLFEQFGPLSEVHLSISKETKKPKGFAYVLFVFPQHALQAYTQLDGTIFLGRIIHILPSQEKPIKPENENGDGKDNKSSFRSQKEKEQKASAQNDYNWNSLFLRGDTVLEAIAAKLGVQKSSIMDVQSENLATRMAVAETNLIQETKSYLEAEGVVLDAFSSKTARSNTIILIKNLAFDTEANEIERLFSRFGTLGRVVLPPTKAVALVEFFEPSEARAAFRGLAYSKFKHVPLFLEWAPIASLAARSSETIRKPTVKKIVENLPSKADKDGMISKEEQGKGEEEVEEESLEISSATLYVKNLNFSTNSDTLKTVFSSIGPVRSIKIAQKKVGDRYLSLGFGFVEFERKESINRALDELQGHNVDGHALLLKKSTMKTSDSTSNKSSHRSRSSEEINGAEENGTKLVVRNIPFEATEKDVRELFKTFAQLKRVRLPRRFDGRHRGFGFVEFLTHQEAVNAKNILAHTHLYGRHLVLEWAKPEAQDFEEELAELRAKSKKSLAASSNTQRDDNSRSDSNKRVKLGNGADDLNGDNANTGNYLESEEE